MDETLQEYCDWRDGPLQIDRAAAVLRGVKVLGLRSRNGRCYRPEALAAAAPLYENVRVNVNHPKGDSRAPRDYQDRIGTLRGVVARPEGLFADFHFNPKHALSEQLLWDAEHAPQNAGFSHNVQARVARRDGDVVVEAITRVQSVDLVADPATTGGLFEHDGGGATLAAATLDDLTRLRPDLVQTLIEGPQRELAQLRGETAQLRLLEAAEQRRGRVDALLAEFRLPARQSSDPLARTIVSPQFVESLLAAPDEPALRAMVAERAQLVRSLGGATALSARPQARDQQAAPTAGLDVGAFVAAIT